MSSLPQSTKAWAMMIWYHEPPFFASSGGKTIGTKINIGGILHTIKYKVETAGGGKPFQYLAFIMEKPTSHLVSHPIPVIRYNDYIDFATSNSMQNLLDLGAPLPNLNGGEGQRVLAPHKRLVLSDINVGVEISANADTASDLRIQPVHLLFRKLYFEIRKVQYGFNQDHFE